MNKFIILGAALMAVSLASPLGEYHHQQQYEPQYHHEQASYQQESADKHAPIISSDDHRGKDGSYVYKYETGNGISAHEQGYVKNAGSKEHETQVAEGYYSYIGKDGKKIEVHYSADENGFRAHGDHLPTPPPVPKEIQESLAKNAAEGPHADESGHYYEQPQQQQHQEYHSAPQHYQHY